MPGTVSWFEIPADDPQKLLSFYSAAFGWSASRFGDMEYWLVDAGAGDNPINGAILKRDQLKSTANTINVSSIDSAIAAVKAGGGTVLSDKLSIPTIGTFGYAADPEGNVFGIIERSK